MTTSFQNDFQNKNRQFAFDVVKRLNNAGYTAYWAGGCVRDYLLGRTPNDYDVATNAIPSEVEQLFGKKQTLAVGASFGVMIVRAPRGVENVEVATFRTDGSYLDGRRPDSVAFSTPEEDAQRRDFTINGMFYDPLQQQVYDFIGGEKDLAQGVVRAIGNPHERIQEDKLRMLRAVRFTATLDFKLDETTRSAVQEMATELHAVSPERITQELHKMLLDVHRWRAMQLADQVGLMDVIFPELVTCKQQPAFKNNGSPTKNNLWDVTLHQLQLLEETTFELAMAILLSGTIAHETASKHDPQICTTSLPNTAIIKICRRLKFSNQQIDHIGWLTKHQKTLSYAKELSMAQLKQIFTNPFANDLLKMFHLQTIATQSELAPVLFCEEFLASTPQEEINPAPLITGDILIQAGYQPGPRFRELLEIIRNAQLNNEIQTPAEALQLAKEIE